MSVYPIEISEILQSLIKSYEISESELARQINLPRATVNRLVSGKTPDPRASTLSAIATYFNVTVEQLIGKQPLSLKNNYPEEKPTKYIPIIASKQIHNWEHLANLYSDHHYPDTIEADTHTSKNGKFAIRVDGSNAMWPQFQENSILIIDPLKAPQNRDFVISHIDKTNEVVFRQFIEGENGNYRILTAINPTFPIIELSQKDKIIGTVIQTRNSY